MLENVNNRFEYQKLTEKEMQDRQILGTLVGPCADIINPTRNGRRYSERLWEKVFDAPLVKEQFKAGGIFGELEHPDYDAVNPEKIAIAMPEPPKKGKDGLLYGYWHILNTPCGKILKTLVDYGYKPGISTRGNGDIIDDYNGEEAVDPDTYQLNALDIVLIPAVEKARLNLVTESLDTRKKQLNESLKTLIDNSSEEDKKTMNEALALLDIKITSDSDTENSVVVPVEINETEDGDKIKVDVVDDIVDTEGLPTVEISTEVSDTVEELKTENKDVGVEQDDTIDVNNEEEITTDNDGDSLIVDLREALQRSADLARENEELKSKLSVGNSKEEALNESIEKYKSKIAELVESTKILNGLKARSNRFESQYNTVKQSSERKIESLTKTNNIQKINLRQLESSKNKREADANRYRELFENYRKENIALKESYEEQIRSLKESIENSQRENEEKLNSLSERYNTELENANNNINSLREKNKTLTKKLQKMTEAYAKKSCDIYDIDVKPIMAQTKEFAPEEIDRLTENYSNRKLTESKLPFQISKIKNIGYSGAKQTQYHNSYNDDDIDISEIYNN